MRLAPTLFLAVAVGASAASAQTPKDGRYVQVDSTVRRFAMYRDTLRPESGRPGGYFTIKDMTWKDGWPHFCIHAYHIYSDYGWNDYEICTAGNITYGLLAFRWPDSVSWYKNNFQYVMAPAVADTLRTLLSISQDTVRLSFWWIYISRGNPRRNFVIPGHVGEKQIDSLTMKLARLYGAISTSSPAEVTLNFHSLAFVPAESVGLHRPPAAPWRPWRSGFEWPAAAHDLLGRLPAPRAR